MVFQRRSGILLHPTSLSGTPGIGTLGRGAYSFVDWLVSAGQSLWQVLPLGPTGYGDSPYASFSTYAGNPLLIDLEYLVEKGRAEAVSILPPEYIRSEGPVDYGSVVWWKMPVLRQAALWFIKSGTVADKDAYHAFKEANSFWLDKYASFMTIKEYYDAASQKKKLDCIWYRSWPEELAACNDSALVEWNDSHILETEIVKTIQFFFFDQWHALKTYANKNGISIIGDIPIFVAPDSADVWSNQKLFLLDSHGVPVKVAGVPPDYFSATGQLWGNPLYNWDAMKKDGYEWWIRRILHILSMVDYLRIDHFRGFEAYWSVPYGEKTAVKGKWMSGPGKDLFEALKKSAGRDLPVIAEDLGLITDEVIKLRTYCGFPGMKVLQFAFDPVEAKHNGMINSFLPHMYNSDCIVYTGTHDNDTLQGWLESIPVRQLRLVAGYMTGTDINAARAVELMKTGDLRRKMITAAFASTAAFTVIPMQDILGVGHEGRMNTPSTTGANWTWRMDKKLPGKCEAEKLAIISDLYGRNISGKQH